MANQVWTFAIFFCWFLHQTLCFARPGMANHVGTPVPGLEQVRPANHDCHAGSLYPLTYDAELPCATTEVLSNPVGIIPTTPAYDPAPVAHKGKGVSPWNPVIEY
jgi:hypothetical protein